MRTTPPPVWVSGKSWCPTLGRKPSAMVEQIWGKCFVWGQVVEDTPRAIRKQPEDNPTLGFARMSDLTRFGHNETKRSYRSCLLDFLPHVGFFPLGLGWCGLGWWVCRKPNRKGRSAVKECWRRLTKCHCSGEAEAEAGAGVLLALDIVTPFPGFGRVNTSVRADFGSCTEYSETVPANLLQLSILPVLLLGARWYHWMTLIRSFWKLVISVKVLHAPYRMFIGTNLAEHWVRLVNENVRQGLRSALMFGVTWVAWDVGFVEVSPQERLSSLPRGFSSC